MSIHLAELLERAIPGADVAPPLPPADERLAQGRRGVRRRRAGGGALALAAAAAAVVVPGVLTGGTAPDDGRDAPVAAGGSSSSAPVPSAGGPGSPEPATDWEQMPGRFIRSSTSLVQLDAGADVPVLVGRGVTVLDVVEDPFARSGVFAWAGTVRWRGTTYWALTHRSGNGSFSTDTRPVPGRTIEQWVRDYEEVDTSPLRPWVDLQADGSLTARPGVRIVEQQSPARVDQADPGAPSATARLDVDGARLCLIVRAEEAGSDEIALPEAEYPGCRDLPGWDYPGNPAS
jgi:hypothetical protein